MYSNADLTPSLLRTSRINYPYTSSIASSASSSSSSIFSVDAPSSRSSVSSPNFTSEQGISDARITTSGEYHHLQPGFSAPATPPPDVESIVPTEVTCGIPTNRNDLVPLELRQHPRRTQPINSEDCRNGCTTSCPRPPPPLVRQSDRKINFVDGLVGKPPPSFLYAKSHAYKTGFDHKDTATQMVETIWPLSITSLCSRDNIPGGKNVISLRTFIQEVLRRSRTSYSTLQVALYYLVLIKPCVPRSDFTMEQKEDSISSRALQCGRRMFLAALILASKYLQDRNFSTRAWSKICGLTSCEINANERAFLQGVNYEIHVTESIYQRWTDVVLKYTPSAHPRILGRPYEISSRTWRAVILSLTPDLQNLDLSSLLSPDATPPRASSPTATPTANQRQTIASEQEISKIPSNTSVVPRVLEALPSIPPLVRMQQLPTPRMTPQTTDPCTPAMTASGPCQSRALNACSMEPAQTNHFCTPAVSASGLCTSRSSMGIAMKQVQKISLARSTCDQWATKVGGDGAFLTATRRSSLAQSDSSFSSPESMISDISSRSSRSSSISSVAASACALPQPPLAVQAIRRCANMQKCGQRENDRLTVEPEPTEWQYMPLVTSPEDGYAVSMGELPTSQPQAQYTEVVQISARPLHHAAPTSITTKNIKTYNNSENQAAESLRDLALQGQEQRATARPQVKGRKRGRPISVDLSLPVYQKARNQLTPKIFSDITNRQDNEEDSTVLPDRSLADSFLLRPSVGENLKPVPSCKKARLAKEGFSKKRICFEEKSTGLNQLTKEIRLSIGWGLARNGSG